ncbi:MAG: hypothetical protein GTO45_19110, partial [Candidatus Aminicenantes bacterium]|nr:hypothetical protein [Candidatus Aminicenantes bacterium]NIN20282.1 hypothetical protein [Candidatus Aminicenantes bacterium]NIN86871.1 hypothetical protein [Candidatus Aminicenantes bacterium]NIO83132.1 hypothetical protein [Candidatus Aminicenantes bacterium]NIQ69058.1 hypothetical protein [Candidatus Aminicenantes bacterium]
MKPNSIKKRAYSQGVWFFMFLFLIGALTFAWGSDKLTKSRLNEKYRDAAREMKECYYNGDLERVIDLFYKNCRKHEGAKPIEEKKEFKRVKKEIRANIYQWVALSYFKLDKLEVGDTYLGKLYNESKAQLNETFRDIAKETKEYYDSGQLKNVINLYKKYCLKDKGKAGKEKKEFKKVSGEIRADIYQWLALSYDMLDEPEMRDIYLKKLLDIRNGLGAGNYWPSIRNVAEEKYEVAPRLLLGAKLGTNFTLAHPFNRFEVLKPAAETGWNSYHKDYSSNLADSLGMEAGIIVEYALTRNLSVCIQPASIDLRFQYKNNFIWVREVGGEPMMVNYTHRQKFYYIEIPFLLKYRFVNIKS